jgi:citrate lyase subunit beta / citryl-CoA lyase
LASIAARVGDRPLVALIETARGVRRLDAICAAAGLARLAFGSIDLALDIDALESDETLLYARSELVFASRAAGLPAPIDGVTVEFRDAEVVAAAAARSSALGFGAKLCIHPAQVGPVNTAFAPDPVQLDWARRVLDAARASTAGTFVVDGRMIDRPLLLRAQRLLERATRDPDR